MKQTLKKFADHLELVLFAGDVDNAVIELLVPEIKLFIELIRKELEFLEYLST